MAEVRFDPQADSDLNYLWSYIASNSPSAATEFVNLIEEKCYSLSEFPQMGRARPELASEMRSFPVGSYMIF